MQNKIEDNYSRAQMIKQARENFNRNQEYYTSPKRITIRTNSKEDSDVFYKGKPLVIRGVIAIILFLLVISMDQMSITYNEVKSSSIKEIIKNNQTIDSIQEYATNFTEEKIIPVFHRLW